MGLIREVAEQVAALQEDRGTLRKFGFTIAIALAVLGAAVFLVGKKPAAAQVLWGVAGALAVAGGLFPPALRWPHKVWMTLAFLIGWMVSRIILGIVFFLVITPIGSLMRILGKDLLNERIDRNAESYWIRREAREDDPGRYEKLF